MYDGNGDNDGTLLEKEAKCSQACQIKKTPIHGSWDGFIAKGFILKHGSGRCWCEEADSSTCTQTKGNGWHRYDFEYRPYKLVGAFECNGNEIRMYDGNGDNDGTLLEKEAKCSQACQIKKTPIHGSWDGFIAKGFILKHGSGRCWCEDADSSTCTQLKGVGIIDMIS